MHIHIIGGGIIGLSAAWYLRQEGCDVTVIDRNDFTDGTSWGNAGMIVPSHFVPLASPGVIQQGLKWLTNDKSPFYVKPRFDPEFVQWLWHFNRSCTKENVEKATPVLRDFNEWSLRLYREFSQLPGFDFSFKEDGLLMLYQTEHQRDEELAFADEARKIGMAVSVYERNDLEIIEPDLTVNALGGIYFPNDASLYPNYFLRNLIEQLKIAGVTFISNAEVTDFKLRNKTISEIQLSDKQSVKTENVVLSGGSWTAKLLKKARIKMLLEDGKGYSFTLKNPPLRPRTPTILTEGKVAVTPMGNDLRIGGTLEISNFSTEIKHKRLQGIVESFRQFYPEITFDFPADSDIWMGYRPCTPDGLPYIGALPELSNVFVGTGHGMMGMSLGPATGKLLMQQILRKKQSLDDSLFKLNRF